MATVYDENVRRATQLAPSLVSPSKTWTSALASITAAVTKELGVEPVSGTVHSLLGPSIQEACFHATHASSSSLHRVVPPTTCSYILPGWQGFGYELALTSRDVTMLPDTWQSWCMHAST